MRCKFSSHLKNHKGATRRGEVPYVWSNILQVSIPGAPRINQALAALSEFIGGPYWILSVPRFAFKSLKPEKVLEA